MKSPLVTVCVVTYNKEEYIRQCLESIVTQEMEYGFQVIVYDDASSDATPDIIKEFAEKYDFLKANLREVNVGAFQNFIECHAAATTPLVCHCDGDDYWFPFKLKIQTEYMLDNSDCNVSWTRMEIYDERSARAMPDRIPSHFVGRRFERSELIRYVAVGLHSSKMYRKCEVSLPDFEPVDYLLNVLQVRDGYATFVSSKVLGCYRAGIGIASSGNKTRLIINKCHKFYRKVFPDLIASINSSAITLAIVELKNKRFNTAKVYLTGVTFKKLITTINYILDNIKTSKYLKFPR